VLPRRRRFLLILVVLTAAAGLPFSEAEAPKALPDAAPPAPVRVAADSGPVYITYSADRQLSINREPVDPAELTERLQAIFAGRRDKTVYIDGAPGLRYGEVARLIDAARAAGIERVGIVTEGMRKAATTTPR
jgi:biopolymer transport protein ExbD